MFWSWLSNFSSAPRPTSPHSLRRRGRRNVEYGLSRTRFRPTVTALEDRTVPSGGTGFFGGVLPTPLPSPGPATHLQVIAPQFVNPGQTFPVLVIAESASNLPDFGFTDTVSLSSTDPKATGSANGPSPIVTFPPSPPTLTPLPISYTFTAQDHGFHVFLLNLVTTGKQVDTVTDTTNPNVTPGSATTNVNPPPVLSKLLVVMPKSTTVGVPTPVTIVPEDQFGHPIINFSGTVSLSTSDPKATGLPSSYTFDPTIDHGFHTFQVTFETPDTSPTPTTPLVLTSVTATDGSITDTSYILVEPPTAVARFAVFPLAPVVEGVATPVIVVALNASNQIIPGYTGTVTLSSSDPNATASATAGGTQTPLSSFSYKFTSADAGLHVFYVTFGTAGKQTLTVSDTSAGVSNTIDVYVLMTIGPKHSWFLF